MNDSQEPLEHAGELVGRSSHPYRTRAPQTAPLVG